MTYRMASQPTRSFWLQLATPSARQTLAVKPLAEAPAVVTAKVSSTFSPRGVSRRIGAAVNGTVPLSGTGTCFNAALLCGPMVARPDAICAAPSSRSAASSSQASQSSKSAWPRPPAAS